VVLRESLLRALASSSMTVWEMSVGQEIKELEDEQGEEGAVDSFDDGDDINP